MDLVRAPERPAVRWIPIVVGALLLAHLVAWAALVTMQRAHADEVAPNVEVDGEPVGGLARSELQELVAARADARLEQTVRIVAGDESLETDRAEIGQRIDVAASVEQAWAHGRRGLWRALFDQIGARLGRTTDVGLEPTLDRDELSRWARDAADRLRRDPRPPEIAFEVIAAPDDVEVDVTEPQPDQDVDVDELEGTVANRLDELGPAVIEVHVDPVAPVVTTTEMDAAVSDAQRAISAPVELDNPTAGEPLVLSPADLAEVLRVEYDPGSPEGERLQVTSSGDRLVDHLDDDRLDAIEVASVEASFEVVGDTVEIRGGTSGFSLDAAAAAARIVELATGSAPREGELPGTVTEPDFTREEAEDLGVEEQVSSFATPYTPGEPRVDNIQLAAEYLDGSLIRPGERFSLNHDGIGPRTRERGFGENGFIEDGELISVVGGGVSQMGTTFMNAAWFAGVDLVEFQPHSFYIARYPMGREATLVWEVLDVVIENDSPYGLLVSASYTDSAVTVSFFSTDWAEVSSWTSDPFNVVPGEVTDGFDVEFGRTITYPDGSTTSEEYFHRYGPRDS